MWLIASLWMHMDEASGRVRWLNAFDVFLLVRVRMKGTQRVTWFMQSMGDVA